MAGQSPFDIYESILLLDAYLTSVECNTPRFRAVKQLSKKMRKLAVNRGMEIDDSFRSEKGLNYQIRCMENAYNGISSAVAPTKQFLKTVAIYKNDRDKYKKLLKEANDMIENAGGILVTASAENDNAKSIGSKTPEVDTDTAIVGLIAEFFPNGFQLDSIIDRKKVGRLFEERYGYSIPDSVDIKALLINFGIAFGKKVYVLAESQKEALKETIASFFTTGNRVLFYERLLGVPILEECHIYDAAVLKTVIQSLIPNVICEKHYVLFDENASVIREIVDAYGNETKLSYTEIQDRKPFLSMDSIKWELSNSPQFIWSERETFAQERFIKLAEEDIQKAKAHVLPQVDINGFASLNQLSLEASCALNPGVSYYAIRDVLFLRHMAGEYAKNGLIVTKAGETKSSFELLSAFCRSLESATLDEINKYGHQLLGNQPTTIVSAAINNMIRVDRTNFVSEEQVSFDINAIDDAIEQFVSEKVIPLSSITSFTAFPDVEGYTWNLYLLDCFLRRFSIRYSIDGGPAQTDIVGGVCPKYMYFESYVDRMAYAVLQDGVGLSESKIEDYLLENKFLLRRGKIIKRVFDAVLKLSEQRSASNV